MPDTQVEMVNLLHILVQSEERAESIRKYLKHRPNFNAKEAFEALAGGQVVKKEKLAEFLEKRHYYPTEKELGLLMERYDANSNGKVELAEFIAELTPKL